jgi:hypothetical protein
VTGDVQVIRYRWSESSLLGTRGMGPVATSLAQSQLAEWDQFLRDHVWAADSEPGFTYVERDRVGALIRKHATAVTEGRPGSDAQVLLGERLTALAALGLNGWDGWDEVASKALDWRVLAPAAEQGITAVRQRARAVPVDRLAVLLAQLLQAPEGSYTVIGDPDPLAMICAFGDILGRSTTFASDEADDTRAGLPGAVFLRSAGFSSTTVARRRLSMSAEAAPEIATFATALAQAYAADGPAGVDVIRPEHPPADVAEVREWARRAQYVPGVLRDLGGLRRHVAADLTALTARRVLDQVKADAAEAPAARLIAVLDKRLPKQVSAVLLRESVRKAARDLPDDEVLGRLAEFGPVPEGWITEEKSLPFKEAARISRWLLTPADRQLLLQKASQDISIPAMILWIDDNAAKDPDGARALYSALVTRVRRASGEDVRVLVSREALSPAVRRFAGTEDECRALLADLLSALPRDTPSRADIAALARLGDSALLAALGHLGMKRSIWLRLQTLFLPRGRGRHA